MRLRMRPWWRLGCALLAFICIVLAPLTGDARADSPAPHGGDVLDKAHEGPGAAAHDDPNPFAGDFGNVFFTLLIFILLFLFLSKTAWKPLLAWQQERERAIRDTLEQARREREEAERVLAEYRRQIDHAREEATAIVEEGRRDAETTRRRIQEEAKKEYDETIARARREIQLATDTAVKDLYDRTAELAVQVAGGIIQKSLSAEDHRGLVRESLERMQAAKN